MPAPSALLGAQRPRTLWVPPAVSSAGAEAVDLARIAGLDLDPWQAFVLEHALGEQPDGRWAAFEVGVEVPRQNGKGGILEARELAGLFLLGEQLLIHSAHLFDTSLEAFRRLLTLIESTPDLDRRIKRVSRSHGEEGIELKSRQRIRFKTRTKGGGRGLTGDCVILDEAMILPEASHGALLPTVAARPNPQVWYTGSAVDQEIHEHGVVFARVRKRALARNDPRLAYFGWSADGEDPDTVADEVAADPSTWAQSNPGLGIRISTEHVSNEKRSMAPRTFAVERLGVGDWPATDSFGARKISPDDWDALADTGSTMVGPVAFAFDVTPDRARAAISAAGHRRDELRHVEVIEHQRGTKWLPARLAELVAEHDVLKVVCDGTGPVASLIADVQDLLDVEVETVTVGEHAQACGMFYDDVDQAQLRHLGTAEMSAAIKGAVTRTLGDAWAWSRKSSSVDISPLVACTLARWALSGPPREMVPLIGSVRR